MKTSPNLNSSQYSLSLELNLQTAAKLEDLAKKANMQPKIYAEALLEGAVKNIYDLCTSTFTAS